MSKDDAKIKNDLEYLTQLGEPTHETKDQVVLELLKIIKDVVAREELAGARENLSKLVTMYGGY